MPNWKNISGSTFERPGDGEHEGWVAEPGDTVESDTNPAPGSFEEEGGGSETTEVADPVEAADTTGEVTDNA